jgi:hypothetical protein
MAEIIGRFWAKSYGELLIKRREKKKKINLITNNMEKKPKVKVRGIHPKVSPEERERVFSNCYDIIESSKKKDKPKKTQRRPLKLKVEYCKEKFNAVAFVEGLIAIHEKENKLNKK